MICERDVFSIHPFSFFLLTDEDSIVQQLGSKEERKQNRIGGDGSVQLPAHITAQGIAGGPSQIL